MASASPIVALDSGAVIALSRGDERTRTRVRKWLAQGALFFLPAPVLAEVLRGNARDAAVHRILNVSGMEVAPLSPQAARHAGEMLGTTGANASHTLDALIICCAQEKGVTDFFTSDPEDIRLLSGDAFTIVSV